MDKSLAQFTALSLDPFARASVAAGTVPDHPDDLPAEWESAETCWDPGVDSPPPPRVP